LPRGAGNGTIGSLSSTSFEGGTAPSDSDAATRDLLTLDELHMAARNHALPLEALRYPITPVGLHYLLIHYDIPSVDERDWRVTID
jgi:hypothetical protein